MEKVNLVVVVIAMVIAPNLVWGQFISSQEERARLERELAEVEQQIRVYENTIDDYRKQGRSLQGEIKKFNSEIGKLNLQIKAINLSIAQLDEEIVKNQGEIKNTETKLRFDKNALTAALQAMYEQDSITLAEIILANPRLSDFFSGVNSLLEVQDNFRATLQKTIETRSQLLDQKEQLALKKSDKVSLKLYRDSEKKLVEVKKQDKDEILKITKGQEERYQDLLKQSRKTAAEIRNRIFEFLGGGQLTFEQAYKLAKSAGDVVGVRPALILAVLDKESALGQNVGRCSYRTAMHPTRDTPIYLAMAAELGLNPETMSVSCPNSDGAFGGAMGPAQFIPSTWKIYRNRIVEMTGNSPPSPWRNFDAFVATALYLKDSGAGMENNPDTIRRAAAKYYAGGRWRKYVWTYGARVLSKSRQFEEDIDALTGS